MSSMKVALACFVMGMSFFIRVEASALAEIWEGREVGRLCRDKPISNYNLDRILEASLDADDGEDGNPESGINTHYEKYMSGVETRVIKKVWSTCVRS